MKPGIYELPQADYHALTEILSASVCRTILERSPAHARYEALNPTDDASKVSDRGSVAHALLFEGIDRMEVLPYADYRTNAAKEAREAAREAGRYPILAKDEEHIHAMVEAATMAWSLCPDLKGYEPSAGKPELSLIWDDAGTLCRARPDYYANDGRVMIDAKFTELSANPDACARQMVSQGHDQRAAFYARGGLALRGTAPVYVYLLQETSPPYCASFVACDPAMLALGDVKVDYAIGKWRECRSTGVWPGYDQRIHYASPPAWALAQWQINEGDDARHGAPAPTGKQVEEALAYFKGMKP